MKETVANLPVNESEEILESAHSENTMSSDITPEERMDQIVEEIIAQQSVINRPADEVGKAEDIADAGDTGEQEELAAEPTEQAEDLSPLTPLEDLPPTEQVEPAAEPAEPTEDLTPIEPDEPTAEPAEPTEDLTPIEPDEPTAEPAEPIEDLTLIEPDEPTAEPAEPAEDLTPIEPDEPTAEPVEPTEDLTPIEPAEPTAEPAEPTEQVETAAEPEESAEPSVSDLPLLQELPTTPDNYCGDLQEAIEDGAINMIKKQDILEEMNLLIDNFSASNRDQIEKLKLSYYKIIKAENDELKTIFVEKGGLEEEFHAPEDEFASQLSDLLAKYKQRKASLVVKESLTKEENYARKLQLIDRLQALVESQDDFNRRYNAFKKIQQEWKEYNPVPQEYARELWRNYQIQNERFYDLVKINNQFRDYDFKKNLELKTAICEAVEKLANEPDAISAYHQSQKLFLQWREIGPVSREFREDLWARFKTASVVVNKKHQAHFDKLKSKEEDNLKEKTKLCEIIEAIDYDSIKTFNDWEKKTHEVVELQKKWRTIGFATKKHGNKVFDRFRTGCDLYFKKKGVFYKSLKKELEKNYQLKRALIEKVETIKQRTDWKDAAKEVIEIQNEWKKIGPVSRKYTDSLWKEFITSCDHFFEQKNKTSNSQKSTEQSNLATKQLLIKKINTIDTNLSNNEALTTLRLLIAEWNTIGHVPFKEKDKLYKMFREAVDKQYDRLNVAQVDRKVQQYRTTLTEISGGGHNKGKLHNERDKLMRMYEKLKQELQTYENNVGFFTVSSKGGGTLLKEMENRIERLKNEMDLIVKKIDAIDENLE